MAKMYGKKRTSTACKHYINGHYYTDYEVGHMLWQCKRSLPLTAPRNMQQGYVNAAKEQDMSLVASMRHAERKGLFIFLPKYEWHMSYQSGHELSWGQKGRYLVKRARVQQDRCISAQN